MPAYKLLLEFDSLDELKTYLGNESAAGVVGVQEPDTMAAPARRGRKPKVESTATASVESAAKASVTQEAPTIPYSEVQTATMNFHGKYGRDNLLGVFAEYGVKKATELRQEQYQAYLDRLKERQNELDDEAEVA